MVHSGLRKVFSGVIPGVEGWASCEQKPDEPAQGRALPAEGSPGPWLAKRGCVSPWGGENGKLSAVSEGSFVLTALFLFPLRVLTESSAPLLLTPSGFSDDKFEETKRDRFPCALHPLEPEWLAGPRSLPLPSPAWLGYIWPNLGLTRGSLPDSQSKGFPLP